MPCFPTFFVGSWWQAGLVLCLIKEIKYHLSSGAAYSLKQSVLHVVKRKYEAAKLPPVDTTLNKKDLFKKEKKPKDGKCVDM